jgi:hypothetical protein
MRTAQLRAHVPPSSSAAAGPSCSTEVSMAQPAAATMATCGHLATLPVLPRVYTECTLLAALAVALAAVLVAQCWQHWQRI